MKNLGLIIVSFILIGCYTNAFDEQVLQSLASNNYDFIINDSTEDIAQRFLDAKRNGDIYFDNSLRIYHKEKIAESMFELILKDKNSKYIILQYKVSSVGNKIYYVEMSGVHWIPVR